MKTPQKINTISVPDGFAGDLPGGEGAGVGQLAVGLCLHDAVLLPGLEVAQQLGRGGGLHPVDHLKVNKSYKL